MKPIDYAEINREVRQERLRKKIQEEKNITKSECKTNNDEQFDSPYTMEDGTATFFYIITMIIGTLFIDRWLIYIAATLIYIGFKNRHKKKK